MATLQAYTMNSNVKKKNSYLGHMHIQFDNQTICQILSNICDGPHDHF